MKFISIFKGILIAMTLMVIIISLVIMYDGIALSGGFRAFAAILCMISLVILGMSIDKDDEKARIKYNESRRKYIEKICKEYYERLNEKTDSIYGTK